MEVAEGGKIPEIWMAVLPCMLSYSYIFRKIEKIPGTSRSKYYDFIQDYAEDMYFENCKSWCCFAEQKCRDLEAEEQERLGRIFERASMLEMDFWKYTLSSTLGIMIWNFFFVGAGYVFGDRVLSFFIK